MANKEDIEDNAKFTVRDLLVKYKDRVDNSKIQFLQNKSPEKDEIIIDLSKLIEEFKDEIISEKNWAKVHKIGQRLWKNLISCALNNIDPNSKGNSTLYEYLKDATKFEDLLYGLEDFYRDHTLHSLWVYLIGDTLLREDLKLIYNNLNWYLCNDIKKEQKIYGYKDILVKGSEQKKKGICKSVNENKDACWCIIALCHDLGYSLAKLDALNERISKVMKFYDVSNYTDVGYSLDIEHQHLISQFLELMAMDVRIEPSEDFNDSEYYTELYGLKEKVDEFQEKKGLAYEKKKKEYEVKLEENVSIKCYRDDSTFWRLCRALEKKEHGILSSYLIYKVLGIFAESSVRGSAEEWELNDREAKRNIIRGDILFAIAQHEFSFAHINQLGSLADILIIADELEEFSRYGRPKLSLNYYSTTAETFISFTNEKKDGKIKPGEDINLIMEYTSQHQTEEEFFGFLGRKTKRLCSIYSLEKSKDDEIEEGNEKENYCTINSIRMNFRWNDPKNNDKPKGASKPYYVHISKTPKDNKAFLPIKEVNGQQEYDLKIYDDKLCLVKLDNMTLDEYLIKVGEFNEENKKNITEKKSY
ncbi:hypothetical protein ES705_12733 [subsurface metagenome]